MDDVRPLHEVFAELARSGAGRPPLELPEDLVIEAIISYADTASAEVAAHLAPFVTAHSPITPDAAPSGDAARGLELLAGAPTGFDLGEPYPATGTDGGAELDGPDTTHDLDDVRDLDDGRDLDGALDDQGPEGVGGLASEPGADPEGLDRPEGSDLDFGQGGRHPDPAGLREDSADAWASSPADDLDWQSAAPPSGLESVETDSSGTGFASLPLDGGYGEGADGTGGTDGQDGQDGQEHAWGPDGVLDG